MLECLVILLFLGLAYHKWNEMNYTFYIRTRYFLLRLDVHKIYAILWQEMFLNCSYFLMLRLSIKQSWDLCVVYNIYHSKILSLSALLKLWIIPCRTQIFFGSVIPLKSQVVLFPNPPKMYISRFHLHSLPRADAIGHTAYLPFPCSRDITSSHSIFPPIRILSSPNPQRSRRIYDPMDNRGPIRFDVSNQDICFCLFISFSLCAKSAGNIKEYILFDEGLLLMYQPLHFK